MSITLLCPSCKKDVQPDLDLMCPNCGELLENEILDISLSTTSDYILIYNEDDSIGQANLKTMSPKHQLGKNALILKVTKDFFDLLTPEIHDRTTKNSPFGAVPISRHSNETQAVLNMLKSHAIKYSDLKNRTESFAEEFKLYETLWES